MERVDELLSKIETPTLYAVSAFSSCGTEGKVIASVDITDAMALRDLIRAINTADKNKLTYDVLENEVLVSLEHKHVTDFSEQMTGLLSGDALVFLDKQKGCMLVNVRKYETRAVAEPPTSGVIKGPREGFIENIKTNLSLIERKLRTEKLSIERLKIGKQTGTDVAIVSITGITDSKVIEEVKQKLESIDIDGVLDAHYVQTFLEPRPYSIFNQIGSCEKPDVAAAKLLEGRVAVLVDGSPIVLTLPFICLEDVQSPEDYYERSTFASLLRVTRIVSLFLGIFLPGFYVALEVYHFSAMPLQLLLTVMNATKGVPFPPLAEILFVMLLFEIIREAGIRMPQAMGLAMSVVGALVLGDTAVKAGFIGSPAVMIVALSAIATYTVPNAAGSSALLRVLFTVIGGLLGIYGLLICGMFLVLYLAGINSYETPYLAPYAPDISRDKQDGLLKTPIVDVVRRPKSVPNVNGTRQKR
ncbi:MAG: spore germination protein [Clostridia bacterium]|nr:spore germination protein [Clostridia bacterium]